MKQWKGYTNISGSSTAIKFGVKYKFLKCMLMWSYMTFYDLSSSRTGLRHEDIYESCTRTTYDGREVVVVSLKTQTDWEWVSHLRAGTLDLLKRKSKLTRTHARTDARTHARTHTHTLWIILVQMCGPVFLNLPKSYTYSSKKMTYS